MWNLGWSFFHLCNSFASLLLKKQSGWSFNFLFLPPIPSLCQFSTFLSKVRSSINVLPLIIFLVHIFFSLVPYGQTHFLSFSISSRISCNSHLIPLNLFLKSSQILPIKCDEQTRLLRKAFKVCVVWFSRTRYIILQK